MQAIILAGGRGERMRPFTDSAPKPMVPILGKPLIVHQIEGLKRCGIIDIVIYESYLPDVIRNELGDGSGLGVRIEHREVDFSLGSAGVVKDALQKLPDGENDAVVLFGDILSDIDYTDLLAQHDRSPKVFLTIAGKEERSRYGIMKFGEGNQVTSFREKELGYIVMGVYVVNRHLAREIPDHGDFSHDAIDRIKKEQVIQVRGYNHEGYWWDVASLEVIGEIEEFFRAREGQIIAEEGISSNRPEVK